MVRVHWMIWEWEYRLWNKALCLNNLLKIRGKKVSIQFLIHRFITCLFVSLFFDVTEKKRLKWYFAFFTPFRNRNSCFIIRNTREVNAKKKLSLKWEGDEEVDKRPWCSSFGHSFAAMWTRHTFAHTHQQHSSIMARMQHKMRVDWCYFWPQSMQKLREKKLSTIFIKFYNFVCFIFYGCCPPFPLIAILCVHFSCCGQHNAADSK